MAQELRQFERKSEWLKPSFMLQIGILLLSIIGGWYFLQTRVTLLESAANNLTNQATKIEGQMSAIQGTVNTSARDMARLEAQLGAQREETRKLDQRLAEANAWIQALNKDVARLQAQVGR